uniref:WW domain-containing protein n=1 Tax=Meleagris gallopavo TaxID=9103 RepID=A0A803XV76_MELGA
MPGHPSSVPPWWGHLISQAANEATACTDRGTRVCCCCSRSGISANHPAQHSPVLCWGTRLQPRGHCATLSPSKFIAYCSLQLGAAVGAFSLVSPCLCIDNLWSDQSLETDPDLPPGWRKIHDSLGTYYWHVPTGTTQWQRPAHSSNPGGCLEADGEETLQETDCQASVVKHTSKARPVPSPMASLTRRTSLTWQGDDFQQCGAEPSSKCFAVRSLGWVEIPEEDLAPGKSSIAVNNCIQQLSNSQGRDSADSWGEVSHTEVPPLRSAECSAAGQGC